MKDKANNKGQFKKGNPGKPKGARNKLTREKRKRMQEVLAILDGKVEEDLMKMTPTRRVELWRDLQDFFLPKLQRTSVEVGAKKNALTKVTFEIVHSKRNGEKD
jgi:hypothetical protein